MKYPTIRRALNGSLLHENRPPTPAHPVVSLPGTCQGRPAALALDRDALARGTLVMGATGTGKTFLTRRLTQQLRTNIGVSSMVVLEVKEDYAPTLAAPGDLILGQGPAYRDPSLRWNLFEDLAFDGWGETDLRLNSQEFCRQLFAGKKNQAQPFFPEAAQLLLQQVLLTYLLEGSTSLLARQKLSNRGLLDFFRSFRPEDYLRFLQRCPDPGIVRMVLGSKADSNQALGVLGETVITILSTFTDVFGEEGDFSIRRFVREKKGQCLFLKFDPAYQETQRQLYGVLVSFLLREALSHDAAGGSLVFVCDELPALGRVELLPAAVNLGRSKGLVFLGGLQSVDQLTSLYDRYDANVLLAGLRNKIFFQANDPASLAFIRDTFGQAPVEELILSRGGNSLRVTEMPVVEDQTLQSLGLGDCIVSIAGGPPFSFRMNP